MRSRKKISEVRRRRYSLRQRVTEAISTFEAFENHDAFSALFEHKVGLLLEDCVLLEGSDYETSDIREAVFLLRYLLESSRYRDVDIAVQPSTSPGSFPNQGPFEYNLVALSNHAAVGGMGIRMLFVVDDWIQALADEFSSSVLTNLLMHKVKVAIAPKEGAIDISDGTLAVFHGRNQPSCVSRFLMDSHQPESRPLMLSYDKVKVASFANWFEQIWGRESVRHAKVL